VASSRFLVLVLFFLSGASVTTHEFGSAVAKAGPLAFLRIWLQLLYRACHDRRLREHAPRGGGISVSGLPMTTSLPHRAV